MNETKKYKVIKQLSESLIRSEDLYCVSSEKQKDFFALLLEEDELLKGCICLFNNKYYAKAMGLSIKMNGGYMYCFCSPNGEKFDWSKHINENKTIEVCISVYNERDYLYERNKKI